MATFEETWREWKAKIEQYKPEWKKEFLNWANDHGYGFNGGFFNEFPHTHYYETDLSWLIARMKWVLSRMDNVEERMAAVEELLINFIETLDIPKLIRDELIKMINDGVINQLLETYFNNYALPIFDGVVPADQIFSADDANVTIRNTPIRLRLFRNMMIIGGGGRERSSYVPEGSIPFSLADASYTLGNFTMLTDSIKNVTGYDIEYPEGAYDVITCFTSKVTGGTSYALHMKPYYYKTGNSTPKIQYFDTRIYIPPNTTASNFTPWQILATNTGTLDFYFMLPVKATKIVP